MFKIKSGENKSEQNRSNQTNVGKLEYTFNLLCDYPPCQKVYSCYYVLFVSTRITSW